MKALGLRNPGQRTRVAAMPPPRAATASAVARLYALRRQHLTPDIRRCDVANASGEQCKHYATWWRDGHQSAPITNGVSIVHRGDRVGAYRRDGPCAR
jgi:hypothetical protein